MDLNSAVLIFFASLVSVAFGSMFFGRAGWLIGTFLGLASMLNLFYVVLSTPI